jgi:hypothetical protein
MRLQTPEDSMALRYPEAGFAYAQSLGRITGKPGKLKKPKSEKKG